MRAENKSLRNRIAELHRELDSAKVVPYSEPDRVRILQSANVLPDVRRKGSKETDTNFATLHPEDFSQPLLVNSSHQKQQVNESESSSAGESPSQKRLHVTRDPTKLAAEANREASPSSLSEGSTDNETRKAGSGRLYTPQVLETGLRTQVEQDTSKMMGLMEEHNNTIMLAKQAQQISKRRTRSKRKRF
jgi:hypothetical protein